jgi:hypothetical protein
MTSCIADVIFNKNIAKIKLYDIHTNICIFSLEFSCSKYVIAFNNLIKHLTNQTDKKTIHDTYDENGNSIWTIGDFDICVNCEIDLILNNGLVTFIGKVSDFPNEFRNFSHTTLLNDSLIRMFEKISLHEQCESDNEFESDNEIEI